jgi:hypothetical protein
MIEVVLLGAVALWFVLWTRQQIVEEKSLPDSSSLALTTPVPFPGTVAPYSSDQSEESNETFLPAPV